MHVELRDGYRVSCVAAVQNCYDGLRCMALFAACVKVTATNRALDKALRLLLIHLTVRIGIHGSEEFAQRRWVICMVPTLSRPSC